MTQHKDLHQQGLEQLAEKQMEEMDQMQARRYGLDIPTNTKDETRSSTFSELFSGLPYHHDEKE